MPISRRGLLLGGTAWTVTGGKSAAQSLSSQNAQAVLALGCILPGGLDAEFHQLIARIAADPSSDTPAPTTNEIEDLLTKASSSFQDLSHAPDLIYYINGKNKAVIISLQDKTVVTYDNVKWGSHAQIQDKNGKSNASEEIPILTLPAAASRIHFAQGMGDIKQLNNSAQGKVANYNSNVYNAFLRGEIADGIQDKLLAPPRATVADDLNQTLTPQEIAILRWNGNDNKVISELFPGIKDKEIKGLHPVAQGAIFNGEGLVKINISNDGVITAYRRKALPAIKFGPWENAGYSAPEGMALGRFDAYQRDRHNPTFITSTCMAL